MLSVCSCVQRRVVKGSLVVSAGCVVHVDVLGSELCCGWLKVVAILSMTDMVCFACMQKRWSAWPVLGLYGMLEFLMSWSFMAAEHGRYGSMEDCRVSNAEYFVHLVRMNRLSACRDICGVHGWQNYTRYRDGVRVAKRGLWGPRVKVGPILWMMWGGSGGMPPGNVEILHALKCVCSRGFWSSFSHMHTHTCQLQSLFSSFRSKSTMYGALASGCAVVTQDKVYIHLKFESAVSGWLEINNTVKRTSWRS